MALNSAYFRLGPCNVYRFENSAWVNIGYVDNTTVTFNPSAADLHGGQNGVTPMDRVSNGLEGTIAFDVQQLEIKNWQRAMMGWQQSFQGVVTPANKRVEFSAMAGQSHRALGTQMKVVPFIGGIETTDVNEILMIPIAAPTPANKAIAFSNTTQRILHLEFFMYSDDAKRSRIAYIGDDTADTSAVATW